MAKNEYWKTSARSQEGDPHCGVRMVSGRVALVRAMLVILAHHYSGEMPVRTQEWRSRAWENHQESTWRSKTHIWPSCFKLVIQPFFIQSHCPQVFKIFSGSWTSSLICQVAVNICVLWKCSYLQMLSQLIHFGKIYLIIYGTEVCFVRIWW